MHVEDAGDALDSATELLSELRGIVGQSMKMGLRELGSGAEREAAERRMAEYQTDIEALTKDLERVVRERGRAQPVCLSIVGDVLADDCPIHSACCSCL
eukprot:COSAG01_NODE_20835_length_932_cov_71.434574_2_plen_99_part_00